MIFRILTEKRLGLFLLFSFFIFNSSLFANEPLISKVSVTPKTVDLSKNEYAKIEFYLSHDAQVALKIYSEENALIYEAKPSALKSGKQYLNWDGKNSNGEQVSSGVYVYVLEAEEVYDPRDKTGGEEVLTQKLAWDTKSQMIHYILPKASYVRTRIGFKEGIFLGTLEDWTPREAGEKEMPWDGKDESGLFDLSKNQDAQINIAAFALPDNAIIVKSDAKHRPEERSDEGSSSVDSSAVPQNDNQPKSDNRPLYIHAKHPRAVCHEPRFTIEFPEAKTDSKSKFPIVSGKFPLRMAIDLRDKDYLTANRFEVMFFVDGQFLFENEEATSPFTVELDSNRIGEGEHFITVNVMDYEDHIGVKTVKISVPKKEESHA